MNFVLRCFESLKLTIQILRCFTQVPADGILISGHSLAIDESSMTGESKIVSSLLIWFCNFLIVEIYYYKSVLYCRFTRIRMLPF